jgi:hypothetical protein
MGILYNKRVPNDKEAIEKLISEDDNLTPTELDFIESIQDLDTITVKQREWLDRLYEEVIVIGRDK